jgi:hypothetical protein
MTSSGHAPQDTRGAGTGATRRRSPAGACARSAAALVVIRIVSPSWPVGQSRCVPSNPWLERCQLLAPALGRQLRSATVRMLHGGSASADSPPMTRSKSNGALAALEQESSELRSAAATRLQPPPGRDRQHRLFELDRPLEKRLGIRPPRLSGRAAVGRSGRRRAGGRRLHSQVSCDRGRDARRCFARASSTRARGHPTPVRPLAAASPRGRLLGSTQRRWPPPEGLNRALAPP